ncbi:MAG: PilZ domain-containing protein [Candidatus Methylomirabilaceae bacterium]
MTTGGGAERRTAQRFDMELPVELREPSPSGPVAIGTRTIDISYRGLYFEVDREFDLNSPIDLVLTLPKEMTTTNEVRIHCVGRVVRVDHRATGGLADVGRVRVAAIIDRWDFLRPESGPSA